MTTLTNPANPYHCAACGAELGNYHMQHFASRTLVEGACTTSGCSKKHSHQAAEIIYAKDRTQEVIEAISSKWGIKIGVFVYEYAQPALMKGV